MVRVRWNLGHLSALVAVLLAAPLAMGQKVPQYRQGSLAERAFSSQVLRAPATNTLSQVAAGSMPAAIATAEAAFRDKYGAGQKDWYVIYDRRSGRPESVAGKGIPWLPGANDLTYASVGIPAANELAVRQKLEQLARTFIQEQRAFFRVDQGDLVLGPTGITHPASYLWFIRLDWAPQGIPVENGYVVLRLNHGNLVQFGVHGITDRPVSVLTAMDGDGATAIARSFVGFNPEQDRMVGKPALRYVRTTPDPLQRQAWTGAFGKGYALRLVYDVTLKRTYDMGTWRVRLDAKSGEILQLADVNDYGSIHGKVYENGPNDPAEVDRPFPLADYGTGQYANDGGGFSGNNGTSKLSGKYIKVSDNCGTINESTTNGNLDFSGSSGNDCTTPSGHSNGDTHPSRSSYYHLTLINKKARTYLPSNTWLKGQLTDNVNQLFYGFKLCNAFWDGTAVNFFQSGNPDIFGNKCNNTGEIAGVFLHEWGHGMDQNDGNGASPDGGTGESYGDTTAVLQTHDSCMGPGFFLTGNCAGYGDACTNCSGVRDIDYKKHQSGTAHTPANFTASKCPGASGGAGPCGKEVHCESYPISEAVWDMATTDLVNWGLDAASAWQLTDRLWYLTRSTEGSAFTCNLPNSNGCGASNLYMVFVVTDDTDGNLSNGTPHMTGIYNGFNRHAIACSSPPPQDQNSCPSIAAPSVSGSSGTNSVTLNWAGVTNAASYTILRNEFGCTAGYTIVGTTTATNFTDNTVLDGYTYYYRVQGVGSNPSCTGTMSNCVTIVPGGGGCGTITLSPTSLPAGTIGIAYSQMLTASGGASPYTFAVTAGSLPAGLTLATSGAISGTPTSAGTSSFTVTATDSASCTGSHAYSITVNASSGTENMIVGMGLGQPNLNRVRVYTATGTATGADFLAYAAGSWGVNVAAGDVKGLGTEQILTGPGPGTVFGPQVRAFDRAGAPMGKVNFFAYGTLRFGVNVSGGDVDGDGFAEILSGAGGGAVFGPHFRGWNFDGSALSSIAKINFFAYKTLKWGVKPGSGNVDSDGFDELLSVPGPGSIFGPQVRGWNFDASKVTSINKINFNAFTVLQYGANVAGGDVDADGFDEIVATPGPGPSAGFPPRFRGFDYDGSSIAQAPGYDKTVGTGTIYGGRVGLSDISGNGKAELLAGLGRDPAADATLRTFSYSGSALTAGLSFNPYSGAFYGVNPSGGNLGY